MTKRWFISLFLLFFLLTPPLVIAQQAGQRWVCLVPTACNQGATPCDKTQVQHGRRSFGNFETGLEVDPNSPPAPSSLTYIVACGGQQLHKSASGGCSTGSPQTDITVYGQDNTMAGVGSLISGSNPTQSDGSGNLGALTWSVPKRGSIKFYALNYLVATPTDGAAGSPSVTPVGGLQQGPIIFGPGGEASPSAEQDCIKLRWDPYGRIFDTQSLEPVMSASVTLSVKRDDDSFSPVTNNDVVGGNITNPQTTEEDGAFSFIVEDGTYKLAVMKASSTFPVTDISAIHSNYTKIYSDIYPVATGEEIVQAGIIEHRDIPVTSTTTPTNTTPTMMEYFYEAQPTSQTVIVDGRVSHPFTKIIAYSVKPSTSDPNVDVRYRQVGETQADKSGNFNLEISQSTFEPTESFGELDVAKVDLTLLTKQKDNWFNKIYTWLGSLIKKAEAQSVQAATIKFDPIPTYLEGYAYDSSGAVLANATVGVYLTFSSKPYFETKADQSGFFKISSEHLPRMAYELRYTTPTGALIKTSTSQFIGQNQQFLNQTNVDLNVYKNDQGRVVTQSAVSPTVRVGAGAGQAASGRQNNLLILIAGLIFMFVVVVGILVVYLMKKKQAETAPPPPLQ